MRAASGGLSASSTYFFGAGAAFAPDREEVCRFDRDAGVAEARSDFVVLLAMPPRYGATPTSGRNDAAFRGIPEAECYASMTSGTIIGRRRSF
ncbi:hypothetical protein GCM10025863_11730 [Microbacterium suwonense]|uniref:Uncharacterized protein n=1 Tax=Microbacterium suwonense TaxID=683047 RepID=A0ABM8FSR6_9MICO|nr:hypothetical protein GCM10025863_11730 [Microbacterium suwonense]